MCFLHGMRMCMWIGHNCWISFCHFLDIVNLVIFHPEYIDSGCLLWAQLLLHFWNFVYVFFMIWGCACGLHIIVASIFVSFHPLYIDCVSTSHTILYQYFAHCWSWCCTCAPPPPPPPPPPATPHQGAGATPLFPDFWLICPSFHSFIHLHFHQPRNYINPGIKVSTIYFSRTTAPMI